MEALYGATQDEWDRTREEIREILVGVAKSRGAAGLITYKQLTSRVRTSPIVHNPPVLWRMLNEIAESEDRAGRGMLAALVVKKDKAKLKPGTGFFRTAARLGRDVADEKKCWLQETARVYAAHAR